MAIPTRTTRLALLVILTASSTLYLTVLLGFISPPSSSLDIGLPWLPSSPRTGPAIRYLNGVSYVDRLDQGARHPIDELLERGRRKAAELERKIEGVKSLRDAVEDYKRAYGMEPPEGFDQWYLLALKLDTPAVPSLYPLAHNSVLPFLSVPAPLLRARARNLTDNRGMFGIEYRPEAVQGERIVAVKTKDGITPFKTLHREWVDLSMDDVAFLPPNQQEGESMMLAVWVDDVSHHSPSERILGRSRQLAKAGMVWDTEELLALEAEEMTKKGWGSACSPVLDKAAGEKALSAVRRANRDKSSFIDNPMVYADPCIHPEHLRQNGEMIMKEEWPVMGLLPLASLNSPIGGGEIIGPTTVGRKALVPHQPWSTKTEPRLWWRGNPNSAFIFDDAWDWRASQRFRLSRLASGKEGSGRAGQAVQGWVEDGERASPVLLEREALGREWVKDDVLRETYLNMSLTDASIGWPCGESYAAFFFCDILERPNCPLPMDECVQTLRDEYAFAAKSGDKRYEHKHKFRLDVDGFGWTTRWREELSTNSVIVKVTIYPEWWTPQAIPWYHYIPGRYDFADLYDIMAYFSGTPDERAGRVSPERRAVLDQRDQVAEEMAARGRDFALNRLREEDMRVYMFLLLLEYRRAWSDDRKAATFKLRR